MENFENVAFVLTLVILGSLILLQNYLIKRSLKIDNSLEVNKETEISEYEKRGKNYGKEIVEQCEKNSFEELKKIYSWGPTNKYIAVGLISDVIYEKWIKGLDTTEEEQNIFYINKFDMEVNNGGISQWFLNMGSAEENSFVENDYVLKTINALKLVKDNKKAELIEKAMKIVGTKDYHEILGEDEFEEKKYAKIEEKLSGKIDNEFFDTYIENTEEIYNYINKNIDKFVK